MNHTQIHMTVFQVDRLRNIVGQGNTTAYQVYTSEGDYLGVVGRIMGRKHEAANQHRIDPVNLAPFRSAAWLRRAVNRLGG
ncbi:MAG: hypothetical protein RQ826_03430 [Xanthomonadales bacterium]|nr:hypothetical protein [Xanthomonadales bacterium]